MKVQCPGCSIRLEIPEEKLPPDKRVILQCPKCGEKFPVMREDVSGKTDVTQSQAPQGGRPSEMELADYEEGKDYALVMVANEDTKERLSKALELLGYKAHFEEDFVLGIERLKLYRFNLIILEEDYKGIPILDNPLMHYINQLNMMIRRNMFIVVIGDSLRTLDLMRAYSLSVELVINRKDLERFSQLLSTSMKQKQTFYKVFLETMQEIGKI